MRIERRYPADDKTVRACHEVMLAAHAVDEPVEPPTPYGLFAFSPREGWDKTPFELWLALGEDDSVVGYGPVPDEYCGPMAEVLNAFNDAPHGLNEEPAIWDADRIRERTGRLARAGLVRAHSVAAVCDATGEIAGYTEVEVVPEHPSWGWQQLTAVLRAHRGHRLGLLVKTEMLSLLSTAEPQVEQIATGNAASNEHMIAVNEQLGYTVVEPGWRFYEMPVADMR